MSTHRKIEWGIFLLGLGGLLFSGYLSGMKAMSGTCALKETCSFFLGYPACYYGFFMYAVIALFAGLHVAHRYSGKHANQIVLAVSLVGVAFAAYATLGELPRLMQEGFAAYTLGLPACVFGLIVYIAIALLSLRLKRDF